MPSMTQIKELNRKIGHHFFDPDTMHYFRSRIHGGIRNGRYFITSEASNFGGGGPRRFNVRAATEDGEVETIPPHNQMRTLAEAKALIDSLTAKE